MDKIVIKNKFTQPSLKNLGDCFLHTNESQSNEGESNQGDCYNLYKNDEEIKEDKKFKERRKDSALRITIYSDGGFKLQGSLRKWWFGEKSAMQDFNYQTFKKCINTLARRLLIPASDLCESKIIYLEIGGSVKLHRKYEYIIPSMMHYPRLQRASHGNETTYFKGSKYQLIAYDKTKEVLKNQPKLRDKVCKNVFIMRFEVKINNIYGSPIGSKVRTIYDLANNWGYLQEFWSDCFLRIDMLKIQNPVIKSKKEFLTRRELKDYFTALAIHTVGLDFATNVVNKNCRANHKSSERKHIREICKNYQFNDGEDYYQKVIDAVTEKALKMKMFSNDC